MKRREGGRPMPNNGTMIGQFGLGSSRDLYHSAQTASRHGERVKESLIDN